MPENPDKIIEKIVENTDLSKDQVEEKIEEIQEDLGGFITKEGAANIVAKNEGVSVEREEPEVKKLKIEDISEGMSNIDIVGRVSKVFEPTEFQRKDGSKGLVANLVLMDDTGEIKIVLWGKMTKLITDGEIDKGTPVRFEKVYVKKGRNDSEEIHVNPRAEIDIYPDDERAENLPPVKDETIKISDLNTETEFVDVLGRIISKSEPREFERADKSQGKVASIRIMDETGETRASFWDEKAEEVKKLEIGDPVLLENATVREGMQNNPELNINQRSRIIKNPEKDAVKELPEYEKKRLKIENIEPDMPAIDLTARVQRKTSTNEFNREDGSTGRVMNIILGDETGTIRASFWDDMVDVGEKLTPGDVVSIENASSSSGMRNQTEIRVGSRANIEINPEDLEVKEPKSELVNISEIEEGLDSIKILGRVVDLSEISEFEREDGTSGKVGSLTIGDETGTVRVTLWGEKSKILEDIEKGNIIKIEEAYTVPGDYGGPEIHVEDRGEVKINPETDRELPEVENIDTGIEDVSRVSIDKVEEGSQYKIRGTVVKVFERRPIFDVCPNCGRNLGSDGSEEICENCDELVEPEYRAVINLILDDGTENIRVVSFGDRAEKLFGKTAEELSNSLSGGLETSEIYSDLDLEGKEILIMGSVQKDDYFDQLEIRAANVEFPNPLKETETLLEKLEAID